MKVKLAALAMSMSVLALSAVTSCKPPAPVILVIGDSITVQSKAAIEARGKSKGYRVVVAAFPGTTVQDWHNQARSLIKKHKPAAFVIALGTNNSIDPDFGEFERLRTQDQFSTQVTKMLTVASAAPCSTWMEPTENPHPSYTREKTRANVDAFRLLVGRSKTQIIAWNLKRSQEPRSGAWIHPDGIHLTAGGETVYANTIIDNTARKCGL